MQSVYLIYMPTIIKIWNIKITLSTNGKDFTVSTYFLSLI
jgi:hypothetical protein